MSHNNTNQKPYEIKLVKSKSSTLFYIKNVRPMYAETLNKSGKLNIEMIIIDKVNFQT